MHAHQLTIALIAVGAIPPACAADTFSPAWLVQSVTQVCQAWSDGVARCLPVAVVSPAPAAHTGRALDPLMQAPASRALVQTAAPGVPPPTTLGGTPAAPQTTAAAGTSARAMPAPVSLPAWPTLPLPGFDPASNPYLAYTPYARLPAAIAPGASAPAPQVAQAGTAATGGNVVPAATPAAVAASGPVTAPVLASAPAAVAAGDIRAVAAQPDLGAAQASGAAMQARAAILPVASAPVAATHDAPALIRIGGTLTHFEFDRAELTDAGRAALDDWFRQAPVGLRVRIAGHADRFGSARYNLSLSQRRAESVRRYLAAKGMKAEEAIIEALGESQPVVTCSGGPTPATKACLAPNRRVEIRAADGHA